jgi:hypothetical protein
VKQNTLGTRATKDGPEESNYLAHFLVDFLDYRRSKDTLWDRVNVIPASTTRDGHERRLSETLSCRSYVQFIGRSKKKHALFFFTFDA